MYQFLIKKNLSACLSLNFDFLTWQAVTCHANNVLSDHTVQLTKSKNIWEQHIVLNIIRTMYVNGYKHALKCKKFDFNLLQLIFIYLCAHMQYILKSD